MSLEELVGTLKIHEQELQQDEGLRREKSLALKSQKNKKEPLFREQVQRSSSKELKVDDSSYDESEEDLDEDKLTFISFKIHKMWRNESGSKWRSSLRRMAWDKKDKDKSSIVCYECKKLGHLIKSECPYLEKNQDKKFFKTRKEGAYVHVGRTG